MLIVVALLTVVAAAFAWNIMELGRPRGLRPSVTPEVEALDQIGQALALYRLRRQAYPEPFTLDALRGFEVQDAQGRQHPFDPDSLSREFRARLVLMPILAESGEAAASGDYIVAWHLPRQPDGTILSLSLDGAIRKH